jgi:toxin secretion/phage lysis holin
MFYLFVTFVQRYRIINKDFTLQKSDFLKAMIDWMTDAANKVTDWFGAVKMFLYGVFVFLDINVDTVKILGALMAIDTIFGIIKAIKLKHKLSFKLLMWGLVTKTSVLIIPMVLALTAKALSFDFTWFVTAILNIVVVAEAFSIVNNIISIKEGKETENEDIITRLLHAVRNGLSTIIDKLFKTINPEDKGND